MPIDLYGLPIAPGNRAIALTAKAVGVELNIILTDSTKSETKSPEYIKINPQHTIPSIVDDGFILWESRAISAYLVTKYAKDDSLYPKDPQKRAVVDQRLHFDMGTLYQRFLDYYYPVMRGLSSDFEPAKLDRLKEALQFLAVFLEGQEYVAGDHLTIADFAIVATVSAFEAIDLNLSPYKNVTRWLAKVEANAPGYEEANGKPAKQFVQILKERLSKKY